MKLLHANQDWLVSGPVTKHQGRPSLCWRAGTPAARPPKHTKSSEGIHAKGKAGMEKQLEKYQQQVEEELRTERSVHREGIFRELTRTKTTLPSK